MMNAHYLALTILAPVRPWSAVANGYLRSAVAIPLHCRYYSQIGSYHCPVFSAFLNSYDAKRASEVVEKVLASDPHACALTGSLAIEARLREHGRPIYPRALNDVDLVVDGFNAIPMAFADGFVLNHVHPHAPEGKTLLQLIDRERAVRVDLFSAVGTTLSRAGLMDDQTGPLAVIAVEDLVARTTAHVCGRLRKGLYVDPKHVRAFNALADLGRPEQLVVAWHEHRQDVPGTLDEATRQAHQLLGQHPELVVSEEYSTIVSVCDRCQDYGPFRVAPPEEIIEILGYW
jgi:hypothetical protein